MTHRLSVCHLFHIFLHPIKWIRIGIFQYFTIWIDVNKTNEQKKIFWTFSASVLFCNMYYYLVDWSKRCSTQDRPHHRHRACHKRLLHNAWHRRAVHRHRNQLIHKSRHHRWIIVPLSNVILARWKTRWMKLIIWQQTRLRICKYRNLRIGKLDFWTWIIFDVRDVKFNLISFFMFRLRRSFENLVDDDTTNVALVTFPDENDDMVAVSDDKRVNSFYCF